jgi:hypothetical protein
MADEKQAFLAEALKSFEIINERMRGNVIEILVETMVSEHKSHDLAHNFLRIVEVLMNESREELVPHIYALAPALKALGGVGTVEHTMLAMKDVAQWWP